MNPQEQILVAPRTKLFHNGEFQGFLPWPKCAPYLEAFAGNHFFTARGSAEETPALKQLIPYLVLVHDGSYMLYQRLKGGGERRLHGSTSLGVGGHVNPADTSAANDELTIEFSPLVRQSASLTAFQALLPIVRNTVVRELEEEVEYLGTGHVSLLGMINDDSNPVGQVHIGLVLLVEVPTRKLSLRETDTMELRGWYTPEELAGWKSSMETWSQIVLSEALYAHRESD